MQTGDVVDLDVTAVAHGGVFVARLDGRVVFVPDAIPGERVRARVTQVKKSFARAEALDVIAASPHRQPHLWRAADLDTPPPSRPGGADFGHIDLTHQRELKAQVLADAFQRFAGETVAAPVEAVPDETPDGSGWRTRVGLHVDREGRIGPFAARSHDVVEVADHPLATAAIARAARELDGEREGRIDLVQPADGEVRFVRRPVHRHPRRGQKRTRRAASASGSAPEVVTERVGEREFRVDAGGFWQVHRGAAAVLDGAVRAALEELPVEADAHHLDLYGGVGLFAAALAGHGERARVTTVEAAPRATHHAQGNLVDLAVEAVTAPVERFLETVGDEKALGRGIILLDPPRSGAGAEVVERIAELDPRAIVYVACDPVALARDVGSFRSRGFGVASIRAFDLFPNSHHMEAMAVLTRR